MVWTIYREVKVSSAHQILSEGYQGKCKNLHGHNYRIQVWAKSKFLNEHGMVLDFTEIKNIINQFDHIMINEKFKEYDDLRITPTAENISKTIWYMLSTSGVPEGVAVQFKIRVWETDTSYAEYTE